MAPSDQKHLTRSGAVNLGGFYTRPRMVGLAYDLLLKQCGALDGWTLLDSSCGYGSFLAHPAAANAVRIGADIDAEALAAAARENPGARFIRCGSLMKSSRADYGIGAGARLAIVGNPPYNDTTSLAARALKRGGAHEVLPQYKARDLGVSFLRSYRDLDPDFICVLHPLAYLIKKTNFDALGAFASAYRLLDAVVAGSGEFGGTAGGKSGFPIIIAVYGRSAGGMRHCDVMRRTFRTAEGKEFCIAALDPVCRCISKYPNAAAVAPEDAVAHFWPMRDINALKRNRTFVPADTPAAIRVTRGTLPYYCYADVFKKFARHVPYYFGNCDVFIDRGAFLEIQGCFTALSAETHPHLRPHIPAPPPGVDHHKAVAAYFKKLLGGHYVE